MKVKLWAKKLGGDGYTFLNLMDVPRLQPEIRVPVNQPLEVVSKRLEVAMPDQTLTPVRVFRYQSSFFIGKVEGGILPNYLEV